MFWRTVYACSEDTVLQRGKIQVVCDCSVGSVQTATVLQFGDQRKIVKVKKEEGPNDVTVLRRMFFRDFDSGNDDASVSTLRSGVGRVHRYR